jgi:hypothetical protein
MARFELGRVTASDAAVQFCRDCNLSVITDIVSRHHLGDWGDVTAEHAAANELAVQEGGQVVSIYTYVLGRLRVFTIPSRSATYIVTEEEYFKVAN